MENSQEEGYTPIRKNYEKLNKDLSQFTEKLMSEEEDDFLCDEDDFADAAAEGTVFSSQ